MPVHLAMNTDTPLPPSTTTPPPASLREQIMEMPCKVPAGLGLSHTGPASGYVAGHRNCRHAAAEVAAKGDETIDLLSAEADALLAAAEYAREVIRTGRFSASQVGNRIDTVITLARDRRARATGKQS